MLDNDNIILNLDLNTIEVRKVLFDSNHPGVLVQLKHTLIDSCQILNCLSTLNEMNKNSFYNGYISIGEVIDAGSAGYLKKGDYIMIPAFYCKFIVLSEEKIKQVRKIFFHILSDDLKSEIVKALFYPLLGIAYAVIEHLLEREITAVSLIGCHALGGILLKLCGLNGISCEVVLGSNDVNPDFIRINGGRAVSAKEMISNKSQKLILLNQSGTGIDLNNVEDDICLIVDDFIAGEYGAGIWRNNYIHSSIEEILRNNDIDVADMIGQHIHAEASEETYRLLCENVFQGKLLVYDW